MLLIGIASPRLLRRVRNERSRRGCTAPRWLLRTIPRTLRAARVRIVRLLLRPVVRRQTAQSWLLRMLLPRRPWRYGDAILALLLRRSTVLVPSTTAAATSTAAATATSTTRLLVPTVPRTVILSASPASCRTSTPVAATVRTVIIRIRIDPVPVHVLGHVGFMLQRCRIPSVAFRRRAFHRRHGPIFRVHVEINQFRQGPIQFELG